MKILILKILILFINSYSFSQEIPLEYTGVWTLSSEDCEAFRMGIEPEGTLMIYTDGIAMDSWYIKIEVIELSNDILTVKGKGLDEGEEIEKVLDFKLENQQLEMNNTSYFKCAFE